MREKEILKDEIVLLADFIDTCRSENTKNLISELDQLKHQLAALSSAPSNFFEKIAVHFQRNKIRNIETNFDSKIANIRVVIRRKRDELLSQGWGQIVTPLLVDTKGGKQKLNCNN